PPRIADSGPFSFRREVLRADSAQGVGGCGPGWNGSAQPGVGEATLNSRFFFACAWFLFLALIRHGACPEVGKKSRVSGVNRDPSQEKERGRHVSIDSRAA